MFTDYFLTLWPIIHNHFLFEKRWNLTASRLLCSHLLSMMTSNYIFYTSHSVLTPWTAPMESPHFPARWHNQRLLRLGDFFQDIIQARARRLAQGLALAMPGDRSVMGGCRHLWWSVCGVYSKVFLNVCLGRHEWAKSLKRVPGKASGQSKDPQIFTLRPPTICKAPQSAAHRPWQRGTAWHQEPHWLDPSEASEVQTCSHHDAMLIHGARSEAYHLPSEEMPGTGP